MGVVAVAAAAGELGEEGESRQKWIGKYVGMLPVVVADIVADTRDPADAGTAGAAVVVAEVQPVAAAAGPARCQRGEGHPTGSR